MNTNGRKLTPEKIREARRMVNDGMPFNDIAKVIGCSAISIRRCTVDEFAALRLRRAAERKAEDESRKRSRVGKDNPGVGGASGVRSYSISEDDIAARLAEIPADTRSLTARLAGDPLPGRSALDRMTRRV